MKLLLILLLAFEVMAMPIPRRIRITNKVTYKVRIVDDIGPDILGLCDGDARVIFLKRKQRDIFETLIHEILHAIQFESEAELTHRQIYLLEGPLGRVLRLNRLGKCR